MMCYRMEEPGREFLCIMYIGIHYRDQRYWECASSMQVEWFTCPPVQVTQAIIRYSTSWICTQDTKSNADLAGKHIPLNVNRGLICRWRMLFHLTK